MKKFFEVINTDFDENINKYFQNVFVDKIKKNKTNECLNFYLLSSEYIPYDYIKTAENYTTNYLFDIDSDENSYNDLKKSPVNFIVEYNFPDDFTSKRIFEFVKNDLFKFIRDKKPLLLSFIRDEYFDFTDENTLQIGFDHINSFKKHQDELVEYIKYLFKIHFKKMLNINILWLENYFTSNKNIENNIESKKIENANDKSQSINKSNINNYSKNSSNFRKKTIKADGDILYGEVRKIKFANKTVSELLYEIENIETKGIIYNLKKYIPKNKNLCIFSVFITDIENCIEIKFFDDASKIDDFYKQFVIGTEILVNGRVVNDIYSKALVIQPYFIKKISKHDVIEFGKVGEEDYYNEIITSRVDDEKVKRVELHLHTKSSAQDGIGDIKQYIKTAKQFGMTAMAITDHGCVNALADANEFLSKKYKNDNFKIINGVEGYLVEDSFAYFHDENNNDVEDIVDFNSDFVVYNIISSGFNKLKDGVLKIEALKIRDKVIVDKFESFVYYDKVLTLDIKDRTKILPHNVQNAPELKNVLDDFTKFISNSCIVSINENYVWKLSDILKDNGFANKYVYFNYSIFIKLLFPTLKNLTSRSFLKDLNLKDTIYYNKDSIDTNYNTIHFYAELLIATFNKISLEYNIKTLNELKNKFVITNDFLKRQKYYHIILLAKNDVGRVNLYKIVSDSHVDYMFNKRPRIPRHLLTKYREGILVGSACIMGEFMDAVKNNIDDYKLKEIASFYDYLEIQPTLNNSFLLNSEPEHFKNIKDLEELNIKVIKIGEELNKLVVATCDCHYVDKEDKIYREILRTGIASKKVNLDKTGNLKAELSSELESTNQELLYFRTTKEMLDEFSYLGVDKAYEVVVKNTNIINNMIEKIYPVRFDKCPPQIEGSDQELTNACISNLNKIYGENVPSDIKERLDKELKYIIDNGYSVMYIAAKKLIDYSKEYGYPVGSRGSVGSSLAATLAGVSEVNPLKPYYLCPKCHHIEYDSDFTKTYINDTGFDMPDKYCSNCNTLMNKDGVNIPFETFLGIPGDKRAQKEPDIDLNFCSIFQSKIHDKTIEMFGKDNTYKAGTVGTIAAKTAFGYVKRFKKITGIDLNNNQIDYYKSKIIDCKNNTGQHPGGMVVVPNNEKIYTFTPINIAADKDGNDITTHFDYHKIDDNLLKLDILGHEAPLLLKKLQELTNVDYNSIPFYEKNVLNLFKNTDSLGITPNDISGTKLGCLTIPEFGTDFAINMCLDAKPETVADLIRIAGLAHGTNVWQNNVQNLIKNGDCTLKTAICCRDDIMLYLIEKGIDSGIAFNIMERVRKGNQLTDEYRDIMKKHSVPDWYIGCCDKIQYMFPKAHAAAYVLAALRIAYYKVHFPIEYYAAYFSIDKSGFNYRLMIEDKEEIHYRIEKIQKIINERKNNDTRFASEIDNADKPIDAVQKLYKKLSGDIDTTDDNNEEDDDTSDLQYQKMSANKLYELYMCYRHVEEMLARNINFCKIDIYNAKRSDFIVYNNKIMPSFDSIAGIGTKDYFIDYNDDIPKQQKSTAMKCEIESKNGEYTSIENFIKRTGVHNAQIAEMKELGIFDNMRDNEAITVFDYLNN